MGSKRSDKQNDLASLISEAEKAVESVKEPRLREIAFERVLNHLLLSSDEIPKIKEKKLKSTSRKSKTKSTNTSSKTEGPLVWVKELVDEGFFKKPKSSKDIQDELDKRGHRLKATDLTLPLQKLCRDKKLRRDRIAKTEGEKKLLHWFNW